MDIIQVVQRFLQIQHHQQKRTDYSNDTAAATPKGPLTAAKRYFGASSNADYGLVVGVVVLTDQEWIVLIFQMILPQQ